MEQNSSSIYRNLMAAGLLGLAYKATEDSEVIDDAIKESLAKPLQYHACRAIVSAMSGCGLSSSNLPAFVEQNPDDEAAQLALAIARVLSRDPEGKRAIEGLLVTSTDGAVRETATSMLDVIRRHQDLLS